MTRPPSATGVGVPPGPSPDDLGLDGLGFLLGAAHRARRRQWEARLADLGIRAPQAAVLRLVTAEPGQGVRQLARRLGTDPMNVQRIVESLVEAGLCRSRPDPHDARRRPLHPTGRGRRLARTVADRGRRSEQCLADALGEERYDALVATLEALIDHDRGSAPA